MATKDNGTTDTSFEAQWPIPADVNQVFKLGEVEYRFDPHARLPFPVKQFNKEGFQEAVGRGISAYDRLTATGQIPARPGYVAPAEGTTVAKVGRTPRTIKITLADGTVVEGTPVKVPKAPKETTPDGTPLGVDLTTGEPIEAAAQS